MRCFNTSINVTFVVVFVCVCELGCFDCEQDRSLLCSNSDKIGVFQISSKLISPLPDS